MVDTGLLPPPPPRSQNSSGRSVCLELAVIRNKHKLQRSLEVPGNGPTPLVLQLRNVDRVGPWRSLQLDRDPCEFFCLERLSVERNLGPLSVRPQIESGSALSSDQIRKTTNKTILMSKKTLTFQDRWVLNVCK